MKVMDAQEGGVNCATKINAQIKPTQDLYWFGLPDLRPVLNHPGREFHYNSGFKSGSPETLQPQVLHGITCNLTTTSFTQGSLVTFLTSSPLHLARVQPLQLKDFSN